MSNPHGSHHHHPSYTSYQTSHSGGAYPTEHIQYLVPQNFAQPQPSYLHPPPSALLYNPEPTPSSYYSTPPVPHSAPAQFPPPSPYSSSESTSNPYSAPYYAPNPKQQAQQASHTQRDYLRRNSLLPSSQLGMAVRRPERVTPFDPVNEELIDPESPMYDPRIEARRKEKQTERMQWRNGRYFGA
ncbi:hypothetical protein H0H87_008889 [Tephrocybe sp. NHM501043]|nr:hypothetical protein H0H87_008889 [Tephrocybe sp. NHM501043]